MQYINGVLFLRSCYSMECADLFISANQHLRLLLNDINQITFDNLRISRPRIKSKTLYHRSAQNESFCINIATYKIIASVEKIQL